MDDTMVSARVPRAKKETVAALLAAMGSSASELINSAYDYVLAENALPRARADAPATGADFARFVEGSTLAVDWGQAVPDGDYRSFMREKRRADYESLA